MEKSPLIFVATPVHNGESYLAECIESVIRQTYTNWQYVIVDNCSTDSTLEIAEHYARLDPRIHVHHNQTFVGVIENHNIAVGLISPESKYCKVVSADDWLFPECLDRMVEAAEANPSVGIVGSYQLSGRGRKWQVRWGEVRYPSEVVPGREICRAHLLGEPYVFGTPTSSLYRADLVRSRSSFYPHDLPHADISVCYECLEHTDFGFVHQVLSYERVHQQSVSTGWKKLRNAESIILRNILTYGPVYLTKEEYAIRLNQALDQYYKILAVGFFNGEGAEYWNYHKRDLAELGYKCFGPRLAVAVLGKFLDLVLNPKATVEKLLRKNRQDDDWDRALPVSGSRGGPADDQASRSEETETDMAILHQNAWRHQ